jgi:BirA family biotin operon repressor/biotin-[acetyl-CoA-carboxylase] ligase
VILDERVRRSLAAETRFADIRLVDETGSTNSDVARLAGAGAPEGLVLSADHQTAGRGRLDRSWEARPGDGLLVSILLRPSGLPLERRGLIASAVALAARTACAQVAGVTPDIKWPNDLLAPSGEKLAGILAVEASGAVVVGMGLNVHGAPPGAAFLDDLAGRRSDRAGLLERLLRGLDPLLDDWDTVAARYREECATVGRQVSVELVDGSSLTGTAEGVDDLGLLVVRQADGSSRHLAVGDVTHLR